MTPAERKAKRQEAVALIESGEGICAAAVAVGFPCSNFSLWFKRHHPELHAQVKAGPQRSILSIERAEQRAVAMELVDEGRWPLKEIASAVGVSPQTITKWIRTYRPALTQSRYQASDPGLDEKRRHAVALIEEGEFILKAAERAGFRTPSHFSRWFKKHHPELHREAKARYEGWKKSKKTYQPSAAKLKQRAAAMALVDEGVWTIKDIAETVGVTPATLSIWMKEDRPEWSDRRYQVRDDHVQARREHAVSLMESGGLISASAREAGIPNLSLFSRWLKRHHPELRLEARARARVAAKGGPDVQLPGPRRRSHVKAIKKKVLKW